MLLAIFSLPEKFRTPAPPLLLMVVLVLSLPLIVLFKSAERQTPK